MSVFGNVFAPAARSLDHGKLRRSKTVNSKHDKFPKHICFFKISKSSIVCRSIFHMSQNPDLNTSWIEAAWRAAQKSSIYIYIYVFFVLLWRLAICLFYILFHHWHPVTHPHWAAQDVCAVEEEDLASNSICSVSSTCDELISRTVLQISERLISIWHI